MSLTPVRLLVAYAFLLHSWVAAIAEDVPSPSEPVTGGEVAMLVHDESNQPLAGAKLSLLSWTGVWKELDNEKLTDATGRATIEGVPLDKYAGVRVTADGYATTLYEVEFDKPSRREVTFKLVAPVRSVVRIENSDGEPIAGAEIQRMEIIGPNDETNYITQKTANGLLAELTPSDESGLLTLPALPTGSRLTFSIVHPLWKAIAIRNIVADAGEIASITMLPGSLLRIELLPEPGVPQSLDGLELQVSLYAESLASKDPVTIIHPFKVVNNAVELTVYPINYQQLTASLDDYLVTPELVNFPTSPIKQLNLSFGEPQTIQLNVRRKVMAKGKIVDRDGKPVPGVSVYGSVDANSPQWPVEASDGKSDTRSAMMKKWSSGGDAESDSNGEYEIALSPGKVYVETIHMGFFAKPNLVEFVVSRDEKATVPTFTMYPVPTLRGVVRDADGNAMSNMLVRMRSRGYGDADPVGVTGTDGSFELTMSRIPYAGGMNGLVESVFVVAVDPNSDQAGMSEVDVADSDATQSIVVELSPRPSAWVLDPLGEPAQDVEIAALAAQHATESQHKFPAGVVGETAPNISSGTWLNTDATSLRDFRGKFVLLDFWFIGCGPCHRDMPSVKMAQQLFSDQGFSVVSVHRKGQTADAVRDFAAENTMDYPIVVDDSAGTITDQYQSLGVNSYPSYLLIAPDGRILHNDRTCDGPSLRQFKLEKIYQALHPPPAEESAPNE